MKSLNPARISAPIVGALLCLFVATGCAATGTSLSGDYVSSADPDAMWAEGQERSRKGEKLLKKGEKRMAEARAQVRKGEAMIREGNEGVLKSRRDYEAAARKTGAATAPNVVSDEAKRLKAIGKRWEDALETIKDGTKLVEKGNKNIGIAHGEIRDGRVLIESGSVLMRNSERMRRGDELLPIINSTGSTSEK